MTLQISQEVAQRLGSASEQCEADVERLLNTLTGQVEGVRVSFQGKGARAFFDLYEAWSLAVTKTVKSLDEFQSNLSYTATAQDEADDEALAGSAQLRARLDAGGLA